MLEKHQPERFSILDSEKRVETARHLTAVALKISMLTDNFSQVERMPRYSNGRRENDVEHSYMLAIVAPEMAKMLNLDLDLNLIRSFALTHDLLEVKVGDVATFDLTPAQLEEKERLEQAAKLELLDELPELTAESLEVYEQQDSREAVFVRMVDKLLPVAVDLTGDGVRVLREDYGINSHSELVSSHNTLHTRLLEKYGNDFPDLVAAHALLCELLEQKYLETVEQKYPEKEQKTAKEIELKYLVDLENVSKHIDLDNERKSHLQQGYVAIGADGSETRIRSFDDTKFELTVKSPGMVERGEQTSIITKEMFESLWPQTDGRRVTKTRYYIPHGQLTIDLDVYEDHLEGLVTAEVEFDGRPTEARIKATTYEPPVWFGDDISRDSRYKNHNLAKQLPIDLTALDS